MKFLPFFLISFVLALVLNGLEAAVSDDLDKLFVDAKKLVDWQNKRITWMQPSLNILSSGGHQEPKQVADKLEKTLNIVKDKDLKLHLETVEKSEKSLRDVKDKLESQNYHLEDLVRKLDEDVEDLKPKPQQAFDARKLFKSAENELKSQAEKVETVEELIRSERNKNEKHAENILKAEKLLTEMRDEANLQQFQNISKAVESFGELKNKTKSHLEQLASVEPLRSVEDEADQAKEVEAAKKLLRELEAVVKAQAQKFVAADLLIKGATDVYELQLKLAAAAPSLDAVKFEKQSDPHVLEIEKLLHELSNNIKLETKKIAEGAELCQTVTDLAHKAWEERVARVQKMKRTMPAN